MLYNVTTNAWGNGSFNNLFFQGTSSPVIVEVSKWMSQSRVEQNEILTRQVKDSGRYQKLS